MSEFERYSKIKESSPKSFGILFSIIFFLIFLYFFYIGEIFILPLIIVSGIFLLLSLFFPRLLFYPNKIWLRFGLLLGSIISPIVMIIIYIISIVPFSLYFRIVNKDILNIKINKKCSSYWSENKQRLVSMKNQY